MSFLLPPSDNPVLRKYLADVVAWHGYVRFLGLPSYQNNPDVPLDELYVPHTVSDTYLSPDSDPRGWVTFDPVQRLLRSQRLVILGDPGSGKSTLVNWLAWYLSSGFSRKLPGKLANLLPLPLVIRDLVLTDVDSFDGLITAFLERPVAKEIATQKIALYEYLNAGQVLLLVDGLDEIGVEGRKQIKEILRKGLEQYPNVFALCTSRVIGYEEVPISGVAREVDATALTLEVTAEAKKVSAEIKLGGRDSPVDLCYVAPFSDQQISTFALHWYREQGGPDLEARLLRDEFVSAIRSNESTLRLARTPNLLTMMALIYRVRARLPNGRALLYEDIAQAYLESIDTARKLKDEFSWLSKKRWLARVGFEMQLRRVANGTQERVNQELLIQRADILRWVSDAIRLSGENVAPDYAEKYLDWITRRSGLLLPRGEGLFAFLHLSFQEYFAALFVKQQMEYPGWFSSDLDAEDGVDLRVSRQTVEEWANEPIWQQTCIFLFELCAEKPGWPKQLMSIFFPQSWSEGECWSKVDEEKSRRQLRQRGHFCIQILSNPHGGLSSALRGVLLQGLRHLAWNEQRWIGPRMDSERLFLQVPLLAQVISNGVLRNEALNWIKDFPVNCDSFVLSRLDEIHEGEITSLISSISWIKHLSLGTARSGDLEKLDCLENLESLNLDLCDIRDISVLSVCKKLKILSADGATIQSIEPLQSLTELKHLSLSGIGIEDLSPIRNLSKLQYLALTDTSASDIRPLSGLSELRLLFLGGAKIRDIKPLETLKKLEYLLFTRVAVTNLKPLAKLPALIYLSINNPKLVNIAPLANLSRLYTLDIDSTGVKDLSPVANMSSLLSLSINKTPVRDLSPVSNLKKLRTLLANDTEISDLTPLVGLTELVMLSITGTQVKSTDVLSSNPKLTIRWPN